MVLRVAPDRGTIMLIQGIKTALAVVALIGLYIMGAYLDS